MENLINKIEALRYDIEQGNETEVIKISVRLIDIKHDVLNINKLPNIKSDTDISDIYKLAIKFSEEDFITIINHIRNI